MMAQLGHMDRETSLEYVHIQQRALDRAKELIAAEQSEIMKVAERHPAQLEGRPTAQEASKPTLILDSGENPGRRR
jgi:hypothetical protein